MPHLFTNLSHSLSLHAPSNQPWVFSVNQSDFTPYVNQSIMLLRSNFKSVLLSSAVSAHFSMNCCEWHTLCSPCVVSRCYHLSRCLTQTIILSWGFGSKHGYAAGDCIQFLGHSECSPTFMQRLSNGWARSLTVKSKIVASLQPQAFLFPRSMSWQSKQWAVFWLW